MNPIRLRFTKSFYVRQGCLGTMFVFFGVVIPLLARHPGPVMWMAPVILISPWLFFVLREYRMAARVVDDAGITRGDGKRFSWNEFRKVQDVHMVLQNGIRGALNHVDVYFQNGRARILFMVLENGWAAIEFIRRKAASLEKKPETESPRPVDPSVAAAPAPLCPDKCSVCGSLGTYHMAMQTHGREDEDTSLPPAAGMLKTIRQVLHPDEGKGDLEQCPQCGAWFFYRTKYEYFATGSEDSQILLRLAPEEVAKLNDAAP